jgi:hypothetical protein
VVSQSAIRNAIDETRYKRLVTAMAVFLVVLGCIPAKCGRPAQSQVSGLTAWIAITTLPRSDPAGRVGVRPTPLEEECQQMAAEPTALRLEQVNALRGLRQIHVSFRSPTG